MPKSNVRKKAVYTPPSKTSAVKVSPRWLAPVMVTSWILGIGWIAAYYVVSNTGPVFGPLGNWNLLIGFALIIFGVVLSTKWR
ncbi:cell division protein CrgA [Acrocarpospora corrugata]|uniref:Cell division protein CrgA n=1 Tax=Acrocarpospora corrugata TaxID=35763 RepID=A0A5M3W8V0_9ACTN|nr:cell division protein CrgA [Acrocarpospora corrugata]GES04432.1 cell division protein CrgA [Acrocarpospora corrugata]